MTNSEKKTSKKTLRLFNGRVHGHKYKKHHIYVAAYSVKQAAELVSMACFDGRKDLVSPSEINNYYNKDAWGTPMKGIIATEPCVYLCLEQSLPFNPFRVI